MAITQQISRLTLDELVNCRASVEAVHRLCSFKLREPADYLDLDWSPHPLELTAVGVDSELLDAIRRGCSSGEEINAAYRDCRWSVWEHPVTALEPNDVQEIASRLLRWSGADVVSQLPTDAEEARRAVEIGDFDGHPSEYLRGHYDALRRFYEEASALGLATAMWWD